MIFRLRWNLIMVDPVMIANSSHQSFILVGEVWVGEPKLFKLEGFHFLIGWKAYVNVDRLMVRADSWKNIVFNMPMTPHNVF